MHRLELCAHLPASDVHWAGRILKLFLGPSLILARIQPKRFDGERQASPICDGLCQWSRQFQSFRRDFALALQAPYCVWIEGREENEWRTAFAMADFVARRLSRLLVPQASVRINDFWLIHGLPLER
jgi:hypothetical protein